MTREETGKLIRIMAASFPTSMPKETNGIRNMIDAWAVIFAEDDYPSIEQALLYFIRTDNSGFHPSPGQLLNARARYTAPKLTAFEAWNYVSKAIRNGIYHAREEWEKFPEEVKRCITPDQIRVWAMDENYSEDVAMSNFRRAFEARQKTSEELKLLPPSMQELMISNHRLMLEGE